MTDRSRKSAAVPVKHTLTSMYRLLKANPLLKYQLKGEPIPENGNSTLLKKEFRDKVPEKFLPRIGVSSRNLSTNVVSARENGKVNVSANLAQKEIKTKQNLVRTQSARHLSSNKTNVVAKKPAAAPPKLVASNIKKNVVEKKVLVEKKKVEFKTPYAYERRSTIFAATPSSCLAKNRPSFASTPGPSAFDLQKRLNDWLKKRGKPLKTYCNLKEFGIKHDTVSRNEENKENIAVDVEEIVKKYDSYEDLGIIQEEEEEKPQKSEEDVEKDLQLIAKDALKDLKKLILEGYSREQCEAWLGAIREKYRQLEADPLYWECLAALEETVGHISTAVEYYKTAIVHGAEIKDVDESLEQMLEKFSLLNIDSTQKKEDAPEKPSYDRNKVVLAARNVFKSSIIQFAVEERRQKKGREVLAMPEEKKRLVVTPVRRSTRRRTGYVVTPNLRLSSSLGKVIEDADDVQFRHNHNLAAKFC